MYDITVGMATGGTIRTETLISLFGAIEVVKKHGVNVNICAQIGGYVAWNRNNIVEAALKHKATHIMFIDNDMVFNPSAIQRLLDADKDIIGGHYNQRNPAGADHPEQRISTVKMYNPKSKGVEPVAMLPAQLFKCFSLGTGFMLIKTDVFKNKKLTKPYFNAFEEKDGERHTEDVDFCDRLGKLGYDIWCNPTIKIGHVGDYEY